MTLASFARLQLANICLESLILQEMGRNDLLLKYGTL